MSLLPVTYLSSYTLSALGNSIAAIVLPLLVLQTTGSALAAGTVAAATIVPAVLAGILMGVVIDRINRRTSSVLTDLISALAMGAFPLIDMFLPVMAEIASPTTDLADLPEPPERMFPQHTSNCLTPAQHAVIERVRAGLADPGLRNG